MCSRGARRPLLEVVEAIFGRGVLQPRLWVAARMCVSVLMLD